jgi:Delta3-Delta2-enoyl-CoA isomerase
MEVRVIKWAGLLDIIDHGRVREVRLARPPVNALNPALIAALAEALRAAPAEGASAVVLSGAPGRFSGGLDLPELLQLGPSELRAMWTGFFGLLRAIATSPVPVAAALTGHSPAGGTVLAVFADYRIMSAGAYKIGLNEVQVGLPVPEVLMRGLTHLVGPRQAERLAVGGLLLAPDEALRLGMVDEVAPLDEVVPRTIAWAADLLTRPPIAMATTRRLARRPLAEAFDALDDAAMDAVVAAWAGSEAQATLQAIAARLGKNPRR